MTQNPSVYHSNIPSYTVNPLRLAWVDLLNHYNWDWFATLTFNLTLKESPKTYAAHNKLNCWLKTLQR